VGPTRMDHAHSGERTQHRHHDNGNQDSPRRPPGLSLWPVGRGSAGPEPDINGHDHSKEQQDQRGGAAQRGSGGGQMSPPMVTCSAL
jgi:hypothetical protein